jgi:hypothetical protein
MPTPHTIETEGQSLAGDPRWQLVQRILSSAAFQKSARLRDLLQYLTERALHGHSFELTEQQIGQAAFGKPADYSPLEDSSVRVHARQLRLKLHEYFDGEGRGESLILEIPKGSYLPVFRDALQPAAGFPAQAASPPPSPRASGLLRTALPWMLVGILSLVCATLWVNRNSQASTSASPPWPLSEVIRPGRPTQIVVADSNYGMLRIIEQRPGSLAEYLRPNFQQNFKPAHPSAREARIMNYISNSLLTSYADVAIVTSLLNLAGTARDRVTVRSARDLRLRDLADGNHIFLGSPGSNPWVSYFENRLNFSESEGVVGESMKFFRNKRPRQGEKETYQGLRRTGTAGEDFATISVLPTEHRRGGIMILQGLQQEGTEAAGAFLADEDNRQRLRTALGLAATPPQPVYFEVLLRTNAVAGAPNATTIVATRRIEP